MNGSSTASISSKSPSNLISEAIHPSFPTTHPDFSSFKFKNIGQPPTLLSRFSDASAALGHHHSPPLDLSDMDMASPSEDYSMIISDEHRTFQPTPRKSLIEILAGDADQGRDLKIITTQTQETGASESIVITSPPSTSPTKLVFPRPESRMSSIARQLPGVADAPRVDPASSRASVHPETHTHVLQDSNMADLYADPDSRSRSPFSLFSDLSEVVRETADLDRITTLHRVLAEEREELLRRHEETTRALSRAKSQLDHVLSLTDEAIQTTTVFVGKEKARLETKKTKAEAKIEHRKNLEAEQRRKAKDLERIRQQEEERKAQIEIEQQVERQRLEEQRRNEEALAAERRRLEEIQAKELAQAEERRRFEEERCRIEEEERHRLAEDDRRRQEERKRQEEENKKEEERLRTKFAEEREAMSRKQEEDRRSQLYERRKFAEDERRRKEAEAAAAKAEAEKQAAEKEQKLFQERRATVLKDKYKNYGRPESGSLPTGSPPTLEGAEGSNVPGNLVNEAPDILQVTEHHHGLTAANRIRDVPTFVPAATEAGRLLPDLSRQVVSDSEAVKHETTSPVITPVDDTESSGGTPPLLSRLASSMPTAAPAPAPATLPAHPHLPARPVSPRPQKMRPPARRSRSRSRSLSRSPRRGSLVSRTEQSPEPHRGRYPPPRVDHYSPPHSPRYGSRNTPPIHPNPRKRPFEDHWERADTPSKLDYSHPSKRRAASPLRSRSPPSPPPRALMQPPHVASTRRPPQTNRRGRGQLPLEQRLSSRPQQLSERIK